MLIDPVCGVVLDEKTAKFKITYDGETYHFLQRNLQEEIQKTTNEVREVD